MRLLGSSLAIAILSGCAWLKGPESRLYDLTAGGVSAYCEAVTTPHDALGIIEQERTELRREIRQRGTYGPAQALPGLDDQTSAGPGPVIVIWCQGDLVPDEITPLLFREESL